MKTDTTDTNCASIEEEITPSTIFDLLADRRRRYALHYLVGKVGAVELSDLAGQVVLLEGDLSSDRYERVCTGLFHVHIPRLEDAGIVRYDPTHETIELTGAAEKVIPYLELAAADDAR